MAKAKSKKGATKAAPKAAAKPAASSKAAKAAAPAAPEASPAPEAASPTVSAVTLVENFSMSRRMSGNMSLCRSTRMVASCGKVALRVGAGRSSPWAAQSRAKTSAAWSATWRTGSQRLPALRSAACATVQLSPFASE